VHRQRFFTEKGETTAQAAQGYRGGFTGIKTGNRDAAVAVGAEHDAVEMVESAIAVTNGVHQDLGLKVRS
jgi:hypothetical protein